MASFRANWMIGRLWLFGTQYRIVMPSLSRVSIIILIEFLSLTMPISLAIVAAGS
jgi:hypothetical protein